MRSNTTTKETNISSKKIEDTSKMLENIRKQGSNKQCFDCGEKNSKNIWLARFDAKKDKLPDSKDFDAVKKHITLKYKDKKYAMKNPEKEVSGEASKNSTTGKKKEISDDDSDSDSDSEKEKEVKKNKKSVPSPSNTNKINTAMPAPVENTNNRKLTPLNMKNTPIQNGVNIGKNKSSVQEGKSNAVNGKNSDWADQKDFTFFDDYSQGAKGGNKTQQVTNNNTLIDPNLFSFSPNVAASASSQPSNSKNDNTDNEWGLVWENPSQTSQAPNINQNNNFEFFDTNFKSNSNDISSNHINQVKDTHFSPSINQQSPITNTVNFNLAGLNTPSTIISNLKTNSMNTSVPNTNNISALNQNLSSIYSNNHANTTQINTNKKSYDDLDKYLSDPTLFAPNHGVNPQKAYTASSYGNMNVNPMNNMNPMNQAMQGGSNNMPNMNPQMMQQMQMMMMNPQMQSNPQMLQYMQMMLNNMMTANVNVNATAQINNMNMSPPINYGGNMHTQSKVDSHFNDIGDMNFNMNGLNINGQNDLPMYGKVEEPVQIVDAFKDIYNYSKHSQSQPVKENKSVENNNFNLYSKSPLQTGIANSTTSNTAFNVTNTSAYNPFDF